MWTVTALCCLFFLLNELNGVKSLTNAEFYDLVKDYATDVEVQDAFTEESWDDVSSDVDDHVIELPGGPDDELDIEYIIRELGLAKTGEEQKPRQVGLWHHWHHHHHHHHHGHEFSCHCHHDGCKCCVTHTFKVNLIFHKIKFKLHACVEADYMPKNLGFEITFTMCGHTLYHKEISLKHPPALCYGVPGLRRFAKVCLEFYNINLSTKHICLRLSGKLDLKFKKFSVHLKLGCFTIPILEEAELNDLLNDRDYMQIEMQALADTDEDAVKSRTVDLSEVFRQLQDGEYTKSEDGVDQTLRFE